MPSLVASRRSRIQQRFDTGRTRVYRSTWEVVVLTWRGEGIRGFYKGLGPALVRVMPQSALTLVVYEKVVQVLQDKASAAAGVDDAVAGQGVDAT